MCRLLAVIAVVFLMLVATNASARAAFDSSLLVPRPERVTMGACEHRYTRGLALPPAFDAGARELIDERWRALDIPATNLSASVPDVSVRIAGTEAERYRLNIGADGRVSIVASDAEGVFDAAMTLAQLARPNRGSFTLPCVRIEDAPALRWRIVSDDVSRGPLPTMRYFKERIRGLAALKINGYSIYMEHVFVDAAHPLVAPAGGITPRALRELRDYAARFHVTLIPEQQTLAHMHGTLRWEQTSRGAELAHGWTFSPANPQTYAYLTPLLREELTAVSPVPFIHLGSDEPLDLGTGQSLLAVQQQGLAATFASHVNRVAEIVRPFGARPMIWDDAVQRDPAILDRIPKNTVIVDFHYGIEKTYEPYIKRVAAKGFAQMVSPAAWNWNEIYPLLDIACDNILRFVADGKRSHVLGMFVTVWHDDGESLYEATWYPLAFAAASAWQHSDEDNRYVFDRAFAWAFFGSSDPGWEDILARMRGIGDHLHPAGDPSNYLFWSDPFDAKIGDRINRTVSIDQLRLDAEAVMSSLANHEPPLHANAARVLGLAARRYDALGRRFQIGIEAQADYDNARIHAADVSQGTTERGLNLAKYLCWELRDDLLAIEGRYRAAWLYESQPGGLGAVLTHYHLAEENAMREADALNRVERENFEREKTLPPFEDAIGRHP